MTFLLCLIMTIISMLAIWNNWIWLDENGYNLKQELRPGFFEFWFIITPKYFLGLIGIKPSRSFLSVDIGEERARKIKRFIDIDDESSRRPG